MSNLIYPNLFLFLYDLREGLGEDQKDLAKNQRIFAAKFPEYLRQSLFNSDTAFEDEYRELLANKIEKFPDSDKPYEGYYYPVRINDTYGLLLACSFPNDTTRHPASCFANLKAKIEEKLNGQLPTLGQTWLILAHLDNPKSNPEDIAKNCCQALDLGLNWEQDLEGQGRLFGGTLFELQRYQLLMQESRQRVGTAPTFEQIQQSQHLLITLYPDATAAKKAAAFNFDWMRLFSYRHKILWAYSQSRYLKQQLKKDSTKIKGFAVSINSENLKILRKTVVDAQGILPHYSRNLTALGAQIRTLEINSLNYNRRLKTITEHVSQTQAKAGEESLTKFLPNGIFSWLQAVAANSGNVNTNQTALLSQLANWQHYCDLNFLDKFSDDVAKKYQLQVQKDYENLSPDLQLLQDLINSSRAITEIDQAERDRTFQNTIAILGVGLAAGSFVASIAGQFPGAGDTKPAEALKYPVGSTLSHLGVPDPWLVPTTSIVISLGAAIAFGALTALVINFSWLTRKLRQRSR
jgi:hypothetical protein